jgi:hypothetical protein
MSLIKTIFNVLLLMTLIVPLAIPLVMPPAFAQTAGPDSAAGMIPRIGIRVRPLVTTTIPLNEPAQIDLGSLQVPGASPVLTQGVTVKAYMRYVDFQGKKIGQIVLVGIEKNGRREALPADTYATQFDLTTAELDTTADVVIQGDGASLVAALQRLSEAAPEAPQDQAATTNDASSAQPQNGEGGKENSQAASYKTPDPVTVTPEATEAVRVTTAGCSIRIDLAQLRAIQQSKTETTKAGALISETACSDSAEGFDLQKSYTVCSDKVDLTGRTATAQYVLFYVDGGGSRQEITECASDTEKVFPVVEKFDACTTFLDYSSLKAVPQSTLIYQNDNNAEVQVRGCQASETKLAVILTPTTNGCSIRHDFGLGKSYQQSTNTYQIDGVQFTAGGCIDDGTEFAQATVYQDQGGTDVCSPIVDMTGSQVTLQSRVRINVNGVKQFITECTPDLTGQLALVATTDGCTNPALWTHDLAAAQSLGQERHYYTYNGVKTYVNTCQDSQDVYGHQVQNTGWQNHDDLLFAYSLDTVYIDAPSGRFDIQVSQVQSGAPQMPYQLSSTGTVSAGTFSYVGCDKYTDTNNVENYLRPDASTFAKPIGVGVPIGPSYDCSLTVSSAWPLVTQSLVGTGCCRQDWSDRNGWLCRANGTQRNGTFEGTKTFIRGDGATISSVTGQQSKTCATACGSNAGSCTTPETGTSTIINWRNNLGWW